MTPHLRALYYPEANWELARVLASGSAREPQYRGEDDFEYDRRATGHAAEETEDKGE